MEVVILIDFPSSPPPIFSGAGHLTQDFLNTKKAPHQSHFSSSVCCMSLQVQESVRHRSLSFLRNPACEMAQLVKALAVKPDNQSWFSGFMLEGENPLSQVVC